MKPLRTSIPSWAVKWLYLYEWPPGENSRKTAPLIPTQIADSYNHKQINGSFKLLSFGYLVTQQEITDLSFLPPPSPTLLSKAHPPLKMRSLGSTSFRKFLQIITFILHIFMQMHPTSLVLCWQHQLFTNYSKVRTRTLNELTIAGGNKPRFQTVATQNKMTCVQLSLTLHNTWLVGRRVNQWATLKKVLWGPIFQITFQRVITQICYFWEQWWHKDGDWGRP